MDANSNFALFGDSAATMMSLLIFLATGTLAFALMIVIRAREAVRRRAARVRPDEDVTNARHSLRFSGLKAAQKLIDYATKHYSSIDSKDLKVLRRQLVQAGIYDPHATAYFFIARLVMAVSLALASFFVLSMFGMHGKTSFWLLVLAGALGGYLAPGIYLDRRIAAKRREHQVGFPDFMDLLVVCADAGLAMEAALDRVGRELGNSYPSLAANIHMANLEIRAGRTLTEALEHFGDRLGIEEARSFRHAHPTIGRAGLQRQRCVARLQRRYATQANVARRGEGLQPAGQAFSAHDGVHLPSAVHRDPSAGYRTAGHSPLVTTTSLSPFSGGETRRAGAKRRPMTLTANRRV